MVVKVTAKGSDYKSLETTYLNSLATVFSMRGDSFSVHYVENGTVMVDTYNSMFFEYKLL